MFEEHVKYSFLSELNRGEYEKNIRDVIGRNGKSF